MKFTDNQKKWAMTGVLLAVLGFNVSINPSKPAFEMNADFASRTLSRSEGGTKEECIDCLERKSESVSELNKAELEQVNDLIKKLLAEREEKPVKEKRTSSRGERRTDSDDRKSKPKRSEMITTKLEDKIEDCESDYSSRDLLLSCMADEITSVLKKEDNKYISDKALVNIMKDRFMPAMSDLLADIREEASIMNRFNSGYLTDETVKALKPLTEIVESVPTERRALKQDLYLVEKELSRASIKKAKELHESFVASGFQDQETGRELGNRMAELTQWGRAYQIARIVPRGLSVATANAGLLQQSINQMVGEYFGMNYTIQPNGVIAWGDGTVTGNNGTMTSSNGMPIPGVGGVLPAPGNGTTIPSVGVPQYNNGQQGQINLIPQPSVGSMNQRAQGGRGF